MDVLVTGGTGFIGSHLCATLAERGHTVTALGRSPDDARLPAGVATAEGDVTDIDSVRPAIEGQDAVVHLVSLSPLFQPRGGDEQHELVTVGGTRNVVRAMSDAGVDRLLYLSGLGADPDGPTTFLQSKGRAEEIIRASELGWTIIRPSVVFGEGGEFLAFTRLLSTPLITWLPGGGRTRFQPIWIGDLVPLLATGLEGDEHVGEIYELGGPETLTLAEVTKLVHGAQGRRVAILPMPMGLTRLALTIAGPLPLVPFGPDQYRSLRLHNTTDENATERLGLDQGSLTSMQSYLGVDQ